MDIHLHPWISRGHQYNSFQGDDCKNRGTQPRTHAACTAHTAYTAYAWCFCRPPCNAQSPPGGCADASVSIYAAPFPSGPTPASVARPLAARPRGAPRASPTPEAPTSKLRKPQTHIYDIHTYVHSAPRAPQQRGRVGILVLVAPLRAFCNLAWGVDPDSKLERAAGLRRRP